MGSLREEYERRWVAGRDFNKSNATLRQQLDMDQDQRRAYLEWEQQTYEQNRLKTQAETQSKIFGNYADKYNSFLGQLKSFDQNAGGMLRAGTGGYYHSPDAYNSTLSELDKLKNTGEYLKYPWSLVQSADPDNASGLPSPTEITRYVADMTGLAESQRDYYGQYKNPGHYYSRPMVPEVTQREPEGPANPDWRQDYLKPDAKQPEDTRKSARSVKFASDVSYTDWTPAQASESERLTQMGRGYAYSGYVTGVPDNALPASQVPGNIAQRLQDPFMQLEIKRDQWEKQTDPLSKDYDPLHVRLLKSNGDWETMPALQRVTALKLGFQTESRELQRQLEAPSPEFRRREIENKLWHEYLTAEEHWALVAELSNIEDAAAEWSTRNQDLKFRKAALDRQAKRYETIEGWQKTDQKYQYVWNNADFLDNSAYNPDKLASGKGKTAKELQASNYYEYLNASPERKQEMELPIVTYAASATGNVLPITTEPSVLLNGMNTLNASEISVFNYLYNKQGANAAMQYLDEKGTEFLSRNALLRQQRMEEMTEENVELMSLATLYWQLENAMLGPVQFMAGVIGVDPNDPIFRKQSDVQVVRNKAGQVLDEFYGNAMIPILNVPVASTLYNAGMSAGDSLIGRALGAVTGFQGLNRLLMTSRVLGSEMQASLRDGDSTGMSIFKGLAAAMIENATEALGDKAFYGNPRNVAAWLAQNFFSEGSEEFLANLGNTMVDVVAKGTESDIYQKALDAADKRGWSRETAQSFAFKEWLREAGTDFFSGALMGLMSSSYGAPAYQSRLNEQRMAESYDSVMAQEGITYSPRDQVNLSMGEMRQGDHPLTLDSFLEADETRTEGYYRAEASGVPYTPKAAAPVVETDYDRAVKARDAAIKRLNTTKQNISSIQFAEAAARDEANTTRQQETRESRMAEVEALSQHEAENTETITPEEKIEIARQMKELMSDVDSLPSEAQLNPLDSEHEAREPAKKGAPQQQGVERFRQELEAVDPAQPDAMERIAEIQKRMDQAGIDRAEKAQVPYQGKEVSYKRENIPNIQEHRAKNPDLNDEAFDFAAEVAYSAGLTGSRTLFEVSAAIQDLAPETAKALFDAGLGAYNAQEGERRALKARLKDYMPKPGKGKLIIPKDVIQKMNPEQKKLAGDLQRFIIMAGVEGELFASETADESGRILDEEGSFDPATGRFTFDINAGINFIGQLANKSRGAVEFALPRVMGHEFTHYLKATAPELYTVFQESVIKELSAKNQLDDLILTELGRARKGALSISEALEEVVARSSEMMFRDSQALARAMGENPTLWQKFKAWVTEFVQNLKDRMKGMNPAYAGAKSLIETGDGITQYVGDLQAKWDKALEQSITDRMDAPGLRKTAPNSPVTEEEGVTLSPQEMGTEGAGIAGNEDGQQARFSERSAEEIQDMVEEVVSVGGLTDADGNLVLYHRTSKEAADKILSTGRMTAKEDGLFFSTKPSGYNDGYGDTVVKLNIPASMLELDDIFKDEAHLRLPLRNKRNIDVSEFIKEPKFSVRDSDNTPLSPQQVEYFKDSKVRDEQGRLLKVYHGSPNKFTSFSRKYLGSNTGRLDNGAGFYFSSGKTGMLDGAASWYGDNITEAYLDIKNPLVLTDASSIDLLKTAAQIRPDKKLDGYTLTEILDVYSDVLNREFDVSDGARNNSKDIQVEYDGRTYTLRNYTGNIENNREDVARYFVSSILDVSIPIRLGEYGLHSEVMANYDGVINGNEYVAFSPEQIKSVDNLTPTADPDIRYSERDPENSLPSARAILGGAFGEVAQTDAEKKRVAEYRKSADRYNRLENELNNLLDRRKQLYRDKAPQSEKNELRADINALRDKLDKADRVLLNLQMSKPLRDVVTREVDKEYQRQKAKSQERQKEYREQVRLKSKEQLAAWKEKHKIKEAEKASRNKLRESIKKLSGDLGEAVTNPTGKKHVPEVLRGAIGNFLASVNEQSQRSLRGGPDTIADRAFYDRMDALVKAISNLRQIQNDAGQEIEDEYESVSGYLDITDDFVKDMAELVSQVKSIVDSGSEEYILNRMSVEQLKALDMHLKGISASVKNMNALHDMQGYKAVDEMGRATHNFLSNMKNKLHRIGKVDRFLNWSNTEPIYALDRMGPAGKALGASFISAQDRMSKNANKVLDFALATWSEKDSRAWGRELHTFTVDGEKVTMNTAQLMSLYLLNKRDQARGHLYGGGIRVENFKVNGKLHADSGHVLLESEVNTMLKKLTAEQKKAADAIQEFMSTVGAEWGNTVTMARWGFNYFGEKNYFPIESARENMDERVDSAEGNPLYRLLNMGFTKGLAKGANNQIMLRNIFDVFSAHMSDMAQYNAFGLPLLNAIKWYNYREGTKERGTGRKRITSVRKDMRNAYGDAAPAYVYRLLTDISGARMTGPSGAESFGLAALRRYNRSVVAANVRVALLQPTAIIRAHNVIDARYLTAGALKNIPQLRKNIREMETHSGIAIWKQMGFYDINLSRSLQEMIKRDSPMLDRLTEKSMAFPQMMDRLTWAAIWGGARAQVAAQNPGMDRNSEAFFAKVQELFDEAIYRTQVVDTMLTRSEQMRETNFVSKWTSSFMSEPTKTYNIMAGQVHAFTDDLASGMSKGQAWGKHRRKIGRTVMTYALSVALTTAVEALMGAWRDDDDYKTFWEKFRGELKSNALDNLIPFNWLPIVKDFWQIAKGFLGDAFDLDLWGFDQKSILTEGTQWLSNGVSRMISFAKDPEGKMFYGAAYELLRGVSALTGHPFSSATREVVDLWNNTAGIIYPEYKIKRYPEKATPGYEKIYEAMVAQDTEAEAKFRGLVAANNKGAADIDKNINTGLNKLINADFDEGKISLEEALTRKVEWAGYTGAQNDIRDSFKLGDIDREEAERLLVKFGKDREPKELFKLLERWENEDTAPDKDGDGTPDFAILDSFMEAVRTGKNLRQVVADYTAPDKYGYTPNYLAGQITSAFKQEYIDSPGKRSTLKGYLLNAYVMLGYDREKMSGDIDRWLVKYDSDDFENAIATGVNLKAVIDEKIKYSTAKNPKGVIISQVTATFADQYKKMTPTERAKIKPRLIDAYVMLGYDRAYSSKKIDKWLTD